MLYRKAEKVITEHFTGDSDKILIVSGARQIGKSFIIRHVGEKLYRNFIEINLVEDYEGSRLFESVRTTDDFYLALSSIAGQKMGSRDDTLVFLDEIQQYPHLFTLLKFLREERRFRYVASGSLLGISLRQTTSLPIGSVRILQMYPLDFEEFLIANDVGTAAIERIREAFGRKESLDEGMHTHIMNLFRRYLLVGGLPDAVNAYVDTHNIVKVRDVQRDVHNLYKLDASKYDEEHRLMIGRIYSLVPSNMENKKKRIVFKDIEDKKGRRADDYVDDIEYLISSGICLEVKAVANPKFPLAESERKNLLKLYLNDAGLLTGLLYHQNITAILTDQGSVNLGSVYETVVATELAAHGNRLFYYDNRKAGEVDYLVDDFTSLSVLPVEVKSGKDYTVHAALTRLTENADYHISGGIVLSNSREVISKGKVTYMPVYYVMFITPHTGGDVYF